VDALRRRADFKSVYERGAKRVSRSFVVFVLPNGLSINRFGLTTPRKIGKAHDRNKIKRRVREIVRGSNRIPIGFDIVINPRGSAVRRPFDALRQELLALLGEPS
jgi:ribonuclease P protein component